MKHLNIPFIPGVSKSSTISIASSLLNTPDKNPIDTIPWSAFPYKPEVSFSIAYGSDCILLKYHVKERTIKASYFKTNEPVYKDTCVEFFIAFNGEKNYYNLEFNCTGTCLAGFGPGKQKRKMLPEPLINTIKYQSLIKTEKSAEPLIYWELSLLIPLDVFCYHHLTSLKGERCRVNFYKCGDDLPVPHYVSWNTIHSAAPNFHLPEFFGEAQFI